MNTKVLHTKTHIPLSKASQHPYSFLKKSRSETTVSSYKENVNRISLKKSDIKGAS